MLCDLTYLGHTTVNNKVRAIDEAAFITSEEENSLSLLDGFPETASWEMDLAAHALVLVGAEPVLQERSTVRGTLVHGREPGLFRIEKTHFNGAGQSELTLKPSRA